MTLRKNFLFPLCATLMLGLGSHLAIADAPAGTIPAKRTIEYDWMSVKTWDSMHAEDVLVAQQGQVDVLFIGDSITAGWNQKIWDENFAPLKAANFGIGGDHTGNLLWRLQHGAIGNLQPKLIVLLIGVNNFGHLNETPRQVAAGVTKVVEQLRLAWPNAKILLNGVFPFEQQASSPARIKVKQLNRSIKKLADSKFVFYKDYGRLMLNKDGSISPEIMGDFLHPTAKGYQLWAEALEPDIAELLN